MTAQHGLVIGKFYPPHAGHALLIHTAARNCARVTVQVLAASHESIPLAVRVRWLREQHAHERNVVVVGAIDDVRVDYDDDNVWDQHVAIMRAALPGDTPVDAVFTSETYGAELARRFGAVHVAVDVARGHAPVSGTAVRADPAAHWPYLSAPVRAGLALRVVLVGAESTGKTTLTQELAAAADATVVAEYGRSYALDKLLDARVQATLLGSPPPPPESLAWSTHEFVHIATRQRDIENHAAAHTTPLIVCDTDAFATSVWHERYVGARAAAVDAAAADDDGNRLYLLTHHDDVPFVQDGTRDGERIRAWMTERFATRLSAEGKRWQWIRGVRDVRRAQALDAVAGFRKDAWTFAAPLG